MRKMGPHYFFLGRKSIPSLSFQEEGLTGLLFSWGGGRGVFAVEDLCYNTGEGPQLL